MTLGDRLRRGIEEVIARLEDDPETRMGLRSDTTERLATLAQDMAGFYGNPSSDRAVQAIGQALEPIPLGRWDCDELGHVTTGESASCLRCGTDTDRQHGPITMAEIADQARVWANTAGYDCSHGHIVTWTDPFCRYCGTDTSEMTGYLLPPPEPPEAPAAFQYDQAEPEDPVQWLERDLDQVAADQDAASIRERLEAIEATLEEPHEWERGWTQAAEHSAMGFSAALDVQLGRAPEDHPPAQGQVIRGPDFPDHPPMFDPTELYQRALDGGADHYAHPQPGDQVTVREFGVEVGQFTVGALDDHGNLDASEVQMALHSSPPVELAAYAGPVEGPLRPIGEVTSIRFGTQVRPDVHCSACGAEVERITVSRPELADAPRVELYDPIRLVSVGLPTMTVYPCGHSEGFTWSEHDAASTDP